MANESFLFGSNSPSGKGALRSESDYILEKFALKFQYRAIVLGSDDPRPAQVTCGQRSIQSQEMLTATKGCLYIDRQGNDKTLHGCRLERSRRPTIVKIFPSCTRSHQNMGTTSRIQDAIDDSRDAQGSVWSDSEPIRTSKRLSLLRVNKGISQRELQGRP